MAKFSWKTMKKQTAVKAGGISIRRLRDSFNSCGVMYFLISIAAAGSPGVIPNEYLNSALILCGIFPK